VLTAVLRDRLTPFGERLAATANTASLRVLSAADAVEPMRTLLQRLGLEDKKRVVYRDGTLGVSWYEDPSLYIQQWINSESAIVLQSDDRGPLSLRFMIRLATDTVKTVYMIGAAPAPSLELLRALWDLGIRVGIQEVHRDRAWPISEARRTRIAARGDSLTQKFEGDWITRTMTLNERP
jgi:hypothetical protein